MPNQARVQDFVNDLANLQDASLPYTERYFVLHELCGEAGFGEDVQEFCAAGGPKILVDIATRDWPTDGKLSTSAAAVDAVEVMHHPDGPPDIACESSDTPRSLRRTAIGMLAEMGNYKLYVQAMEKAGMFAPDALPRMLEQTITQLDFPVHNKGLSFWDHTDQTQVVAVFLLNLAANALCHSLPLRIQLVEHTALQVCISYQDPYSQFVAKSAAQRAAERAKLKLMGYDEQRIERQLQKLKEQQHAWEYKQYDSSEYNSCIMGSLHYYFIRFFNHLVQCCPEDQLLRLCHEGGLISKLRGTMSLKGGSMFNLHGPEMTIMKLTEVWTRNCYKLSNEMYKRFQDDEARSLEMRLAGNAAFRAGQLQEALDCYWKAIALNPEDSSLFSYISLVYAKMGNSLQAMYAAEESLKVDPAVSKSWARLGDAFRLLERWQLAHLSYTAALELIPKAEKDPDILARQADARSHLSQVWDIDKDVPDGVKDLMADPSKAFHWMGLGKDALMKMFGSGSDPEDFLESILKQREGHSRSIACMRIKPDVLDARAAAVATGLIKPSALPSCCHELKMIQELPVGSDNWTMSWTDTPLRHRQTGLIRHTLTVFSGNQCRATLTVLGTPGLLAVRKLLIAGMTNPVFGDPERPSLLFLAHRMFPIFSRVTELVRPWGIRTEAETAAEAQKSAAHNDTEWSGYNHADNYDDEIDDNYLPPLNQDYRNGHLVEGSTRQPAAAAEPAGAGATAAAPQSAAAAAAGKVASGRAEGAGDEASSSTSSIRPHRGLVVGKERMLKVKGFGA